MPQQSMNGRTPSSEYARVAVMNKGGGCANEFDNEFDNDFFLNLTRGLF